MLDRGKSVSGRVVFQGTLPPPDPSALAVSLMGPDFAGVLLSARTAVNADGTFALNSIRPSRYRLSIAVPPKGWQVLSASFGGRDAADRQIEITDDVSDVIVTLTDKVTELTGTLQNSAGQPATGFHVIVFPADRAGWFWGTRQIVSLRPATDGSFRTTTLPAGDYLIAAVTDVQQNEWLQPEFLESLVAAAVPVTLRYGERTVQNLQIR
jgi:hypothetical protein